MTHATRIFKKTMTLAVKFFTTNLLLISIHSHSMELTAAHAQKALFKLCKEKDQSVNSKLPINSDSLDASRIKWLLAQGADPNIPNKHQTTALHLASKNDRDATVLTLLEHGADDAIVDTEGNTPLHVALIHKSFRAAFVLSYNTPKISITGNIQNTDGNLPLHLVTQQNNSCSNADSIFECLVAHTTTIDTHNNEGCTPLHYAASNLGPTDLYLTAFDKVEELIGVGASLLRKNNYDKTAFDIVTEQASTYLIQHMMETAVYNTDINTITALLSSDKISQHIDFSKAFFLYHYSTKKSKSLNTITMLSLLIPKGINLDATGVRINTQQMRGYRVGTLLMAACMFNHIKLAQFLLENGANPNATDGWTSVTALQWAQGKVFQRPKIIKLLLEYGAH